MDREALVNRNRGMAEAFHQTPYKHHLRRLMLQTVSLLPINRQKSKSDRVLIIRPDHLGDVLLTTPAIQAIKQTNPYTEIHVLVGPWSASVLINYPEIDRVLTLPFPGFSRNSNENIRSPYQLAYQSARHLRSIGYGSAIIMRPDHWWGALLAFLAGIPIRIGYDLPDVAPFLTHALPHDHQHVVRQNLKLVENWTGKIDEKQLRLNFYPAPADATYINSLLQKQGIDEKQSLICIHPGSGTWVKRWEASRWASVADTLSEQLNSTVVFTGGDHEMPLVNEITELMKTEACVMVGDTQVDQLGALFQRAQVVLGPDSGPLHLAVAVNTPTVTLFGPADPVEFGPWGDRARHMVLTSDIGCRPCRVLDWAGDNPENHPCMRDISVGSVLEAARRVVQFNQE
ncbi:MAG: glycosyltransferase family 9 protein [Aggregatilineales bacterium]